MRETPSLIPRSDMLPDAGKVDGFWVKLGGHRPEWAVVFDPHGRPIEKYQGWGAHDKGIEYARGANAGRRFGLKETK